MYICESSHSHLVSTLPPWPQAEWARAAVISSIALLRLPPPPSATREDRGRVENLVGFLTQVGG